MFSFSLNSIKNRVRLFFIINIALIIINYLLTGFANNAAEEDRKFAQVSRENEKFIEKLDLITKSIVKGDEKDLKKTLEQEINKYSSNLEALRNGGSATIGDVIVELSPNSVKKTGELKGLEDSWKQLRRHLQIILDKQILIDTVAFENEAQTETLEETQPVIVDSTGIKKKENEKKRNQNRY